MFVIKGGTNKSARWIRIIIVLAVALLSSCLLLSMIANEAFQQEDSRTLRNLPADNIEIGRKHTYGPPRNMGFIVVAVGALSISGLMLMHIFLGVKAISIKRVLGATQKRLIWENFGTYALLALCGFLLSLIIIQPLLPMVSSLLGVELRVLPKTLLSTMLGIIILAPLCSLIPTVTASKVSPLDAMRDRLGQGTRRRRLNLRQIIVSLAFAAAVTVMFLVAQTGRAALAGVDASLRAVGRDMLVLEEPALGTVSSPPTLSLTDYVNLCDT